MKPLFGLIAGVALIISSCATSNEVNGGGIFQKRKYNKGFYWNRGGSSNETTLSSDHKQFETTYAEDHSENRPWIDEENTSEIVSSVTDISTRELRTNIDPIETKGKLSHTSSLRENLFTPIVHPIKKMSQFQSKMIHKTVSNVKTPGREGDLGYILGIVLIVLLIIIIFSLLRELLYDIFPFLGPLLALILLIILIVLLLRWLGIM